MTNVLPREPPLLQWKEYIDFLTCEQRGNIPDWGKIISFCDFVQNIQAQQATRDICIHVKDRIKHKNPIVQSLAITVSNSVYRQIYSRC
jgi:hypothetical protein